MIDTIQSVQILRQIPGTFNRPVEAICRTADGLAVFYLKYPRTSNETDGLVAEVVCHYLARKLNLPTPDIAYVRIGNHPVPEGIKHREKLVEGKIVFGSRKVQNLEDELTKLDFILSKHDFNRLEYPAHLLRIGLFDLWVGNNDRTEENYNLFLTRGKKQKLVVFDHFEAFNKISERALTEIQTEIDVYEKAFLSSSYPYEMLGWVSKTQMKHELESFMDNIREFDLEEQIRDIADTFPGKWNVKEETIQYILRFLSSEERLARMEEEVKNYIKYLPEK